ncbi:MAG: hypothetical protein GF317_15860 [Candidatus Lokiarchaeota archaeon]|nr:hypothetical protein [Candidatus Lokiarchaeota archaeon]
MDFVFEDHNLVIVRNKFEQFFFKYYIIIIPTVYLLRIILQYVFFYRPYSLFDFTKIITEVALIIALIFSNKLFSSTPVLISQLFLENIVSPINYENKDEIHSHKHYLSRLDYWLNNKFRILPGMIASTIVFSYYIIRTGGFEKFISNINISMHFIDRGLYFLPSVFYSYFVGLVVWKLIIISRFVSFIPNKFCVNVKFGHPDRAGGLLPIGKICIKMIYITLVPTILSLFILVGPVMKIIMDIPTPLANSTLLFIFSPLILFSGITGSIIALVPLIKYHKVMENQKIKFFEYLNIISQRIIELKMNLEESDVTLKKNAGDIIKEIVTLQEFYNSHDRINTWPLNRKILIGIWTTQTILWGQVVGLYKLAIQYFL